MNIDDVIENNYSEMRLAEIENTLEVLLELLHGGSSSGNYKQQEYDDGKDEVLGHKIEVLYRCKECNRVFTVQSDVLKHANETGHEQTVKFSRFL